MPLDIPPYVTAVVTRAGKGTGLFGGGRASVPEAGRINEYEQRVLAAFARHYAISYNFV